MALIQALNDKNKLLDYLGLGARVITPNNRLSVFILQDFFSYCEKKTLEKPLCLPYSTTLIRAYQQLCFSMPDSSHPTLLSEAQYQHLWRTLLKSHKGIMYSPGLLKAVLQAYEHSLQWEIHSKNPTFHHTPQTRQFQLWWQKFEKKLKDKNLIHEHQLVPYLIHKKSPGSFFSSPIIWTCFDDFTPQQVRLQDYLNSQGCRQYRYEIKEQSNPSFLLAAKDNKEEVQQLISWLKVKIQHLPTPRIAVVVPQLQEQSRTLQRILQEQLDSSLFDISLGLALGEFPLVAHAQIWLNLGTELTSHQASLLLQSPYIGGAQEELVARSHYLQESTLLQNPHFPLHTFIQDLAHKVPLLSTLLGQIHPYPQQASLQEWIDLYQKRLHCLGFPGDYGLHSSNYQCFQRFLTSFDEFRQFRLISPLLSAQEAMDSFSHLLHHTLFQAQKKKASIQILGLLEASGCEFDNLWVMGLSAHCLPQKTNLSAFIPPSLQGELFMPHSVPSRQLQFAKQILQRLQRGSSETIFSYSKLEGEKHNLPCPFITDFPPFVLYASEEETKSLPFLLLEENYHLPLRPQEAKTGSTTLLGYQAQCPFKAFAKQRLQAKTFLENAQSLNNKERGQIIHKVMELLWKTWQSQSELLFLGRQTLDQSIEKAIHTALAPFEALHPCSFPSLIQEIEYIRLKEIIEASLEWEKKRPPFRIAALEQVYTLRLADFDFTLRIDRLDQVADKKWVIDYKSSLPSNKPWNENRPLDPQLLLYALVDENITTLLWLQLKTGQLHCSGLSEAKTDLRGIKPLKTGESWEEHRNHWKEQLTTLTQEFQQGHCAPQPLQPSLCQHCDFQNLCRFPIHT